MHVHMFQNCTNSVNMHILITNCAYSQIAVSCDCMCLQKATMSAHSYTSYDSYVHIIKNHSVTLATL